MIDPAITSALTSALENSSKVANTPLFSTVIDKLLGFKISEWNAQGETIKKQIIDGYEEAKQKGMGIQYVSAFRSNTNLINTSIKASKYIDPKKEKIIEADNDIFWGLIEHSKLVSNNEMQELIAKILAGEYNSPGTYSMSILERLKSLGKEELENFSNILNAFIPKHGFIKEFFSMSKEALETRVKMNIDCEIFLEMQNLGLIQSGSYTKKFSVKKGVKYGINYGNESVAIEAILDMEEWIFPECYQLTTAGKQIAQHLNKNKSLDFIQWLKVFL